MKAREEILKNAIANVACTDEDGEYLFEKIMRSMYNANDDDDFDIDDIE
jgi:hypothetical protein